jgi:hypothetical protein
MLAVATSLQEDMLEQLHDESQRNFEHALVWTLCIQPSRAMEVVLNRSVLLGKAEMNHMNHLWYEKREQVVQ